MSYYTPAPFHLSWYRPWTWIGCMLRACVQPLWFARQLHTLQEHRSAAKRLFIQLNFGLVLLWSSVFAAGVALGGFVPIIGEFHATAWWIYGIALLLPVIVILLILQTTFDYPKALAYLAGMGVFAALYVVILLCSVVLIQWNILFLQREISDYPIIDSQLVLLAGLGWYNLIVQVFVHGQLLHHRQWLRPLSDSVPRRLLIAVSLCVLFLAQAFNLFVRNTIDSILLVVVLMIIIYVITNLLGFLSCLTLVMEQQRLQALNDEQPHAPTARS
jgi:hypothetical protein